MAEWATEKIWIKPEEINVDEWRIKMHLTRNTWREKEEQNRNYHSEECKIMAYDYIMPGSKCQNLFVGF